MRLNRLFAILLCCFGNLCQAQDPYYVAIDKTRGLPSNAVYDMYQDSKGFLWFATDEGLCRYDGKNFKTYISPILTSRSGTCINEDRFGRIWYMNFDNNVYYIKNEELHGLEQNKTNGQFIKYHLLGSWLFIAQVAGVDVYNINNMKWEKTIPIYQPVYTCGSKSGYYVQDGNHDVYKIDSTLQIMRISRTKQLIIAADNNNVYALDKDNRAQKYSYSNENIQLVEKSFPEKEYITNMSFAGKFLWICTKNGVYYKPKFSEQDFTHLFNGKFISYVLLDKDGNFWISTTNEGVLFIPSLHNCYYKFQDFTPQLLQVHKNELLMSGKSNSIKSFNLVDNTTQTLFEVQNNHEVSNFFYDTINNNLLISSDKFYQTIKGSNPDFIFLATKSVVRLDEKYYAFAASGICGIYRGSGEQVKSDWDPLFNVKINQVIKNNKVASILGNIRGKSTIFDPVSQKIYFATNGGLFVSDKEDTKEIKNDGNTIQARKLAFYKGKLLILQNNGIILCCDEKDRLTEYPLYVEGNIVAVNRMIHRGHYLFLVTNGEGVYVLNLNFPGSSIHPIPQIRKNDDVWDIAIWANKYLISSSGGLLMIDINLMTNITNKPKLIINDIRVNDVVVDTNSKMEFPYYRNNVHISYSILSFNTNLGYPLYYRINRGEWKLIPADTRELELASLKSDKYEIDFRLGSTYEYPIQTVKFTINKPIWQIHWFWIGIIMVLLIIVFIIYRWQVNHLRKRNQLLLEKVELEKNLNSSILTSIKAQMNPHFFYNALNTIQSYIFADDKKNASTYLSKFSKLTRLILEMSEKETILLAEEIQSLQLYLDIEKARFNNKLNFTIHVSEDLDLEMIKIPPMLIQPYVENAIKHGLMHKKDNCELLIDFKKIADILTVTVDDNGIGRTKSGELNQIKGNKHQSFATKANQKRLEILNTGRKNIGVKFVDKRDEMGNSTGTKVIISLPLRGQYGK